MKLLITIVLLSIGCFLFAQNDTPTKKIPLKVFKDGKAVGVKLVSPNTDSAVDVGTLKNNTITIAKGYPVYNTKMSFWEKCIYWVKWFKYEKPYMFWIAVAFLSIWIIKMLLKLFDR